MLAGDARNLWSDQPLASPAEYVKLGWKTGRFPYMIPRGSAGVKKRCCTLTIFPVGPVGLPACWASCWAHICIWLCDKRLRGQRGRPNTPRTRTSTESICLWLLSFGPQRLQPSDADDICRPMNVVCPNSWRSRDTFVLGVRLFFTSVGTTRGQGIIRVIVLVPVATFSDILSFWKIFKICKAQILTFWA